MLIFAQALRSLIIRGLLLASPLAPAALVSWDSFTTSTTEGTPSIDPNNGYLYENDVTVVTTFTAGGSTYEPWVEFPQVDFDFKTNPVATRVWYLV